MSDWYDPEGMFQVAREMDLPLLKVLAIQLDPLDTYEKAYYWCKDVRMYINKLLRERHTT